MRRQLSSDRFDQHRSPDPGGGPLPSSSSNVETATPSEPEPVVLDDDEIADYQQLRSLVSPEKSLALLDDFAKWLFAIAAVVGTLGASFNVSSANDLSGRGETMFAWAVASVGLSLALAALARLPLPGRVNRYSDVSLRAHVCHVVLVRGVLLSLAALCFAAGVFLAGLSPLFS